MRRAPVVTYAAASSCAPGEEWRVSGRSSHTRGSASRPSQARATVHGVFDTRPSGERNPVPIPEPGRFGTRRAPQLRRCPDLPSDLENPGEGHVEVSRRFVPISAAGLQGKEPLVDRLM
ncbi:hypothetical protein PUN28_020331 [Cardiocondyla obscurior]|uniref:Uncharacterized protein n=1 Tax=Cardiocondyla obscurior TaxID=286306 RepID=A0AAW2E7W9_9HYME